MSEEDYTTLPLDVRLTHSVWKARQGAYEELGKNFENSRSEDDPVFLEYNSRPELIKKFITEANVVTHEAAYIAFVKYLKFGGTVVNVSRLKSAGVVTAICEKGLVSTRKNTKEAAIEAVLLMVQISKEPDSIVEDIIPSLSNRLPKLVAGCVNALHAVVENYGTAVVSPKTILPSLAKLFGHADKNVRAETTKLTVELYKWMGEGLVAVLFSDLKPVQQKDLTKAFDAVKDISPQQLRHTKAQQDEMERMKETHDVDGDVEMVESSVQPNASSFDPYEFVDPVEVLTKLPNDLNTRISSAKWKDRKEVLEEVYEILEKTVKLVTTDDYTSLIRIFAKCMKDANIQVVQLAANCTEFIVRGIGKSFHKYLIIIHGPMVERTKEKKASVASALENCLDAIFKISSLNDVLEDIFTGMKNKTPQIKIASTNYLQRCLASTTTPPTSTEITSIMEVGVKLLSESQEPIRQASTEMIGTLMKITGERELNSFLEKIDDNRKTKVFAFYETVEVNSKYGKPKDNALAPTKKLNLPPTKRATGKPVEPSIPSKRGATSPVKRADAPKISSFGRGLTGRSLASSNPNMQTPTSTTITPPIAPTISSAEKEELLSLRQEKQQWLNDKQNSVQIQQQLHDKNESLTHEISQLTGRTETFRKDHTNAILMVKQKETQILRLNSDLENAKLKIRDLEQTIEMMKLQNNQVQAKPYKYETSPYETNFRSPDSRSRITSGELNSRVNRLSIDNDFLKDNTFNNRFSSPQREPSLTTTREMMESDSNDDSWKRAAEVTSQLKARIEKMKARSRGGNF